jgi:hypothetical protein
MSISANFPNVKPSLLLDFANAQQLPPSVTFTRATTATYYNGSTTALAEQNLLLYSQAFNSWSNTALTVTANTTTAPDGTTTADTMTVTGSVPYVYIGVDAITKVGTYTFSCYVKAGTNNFVALNIQGTANSWVTAVYNLSTGAVTQTGNGSSGLVTITTTSITSVGSSWYRCVLTASSTSTVLVYPAVMFAASATGNTLSSSYGETSGNTVGNTLFVWGAQIEARSSATAYTATTTAPITNYIPVLLTAGGGQPRFDHNPTTSESLGLLIEEPRTNICLYSGDYTNAVWNTFNASKQTLTNISPDGTLTACKVVADTASSTNHGIFQQVTPASTGVCAMSIYVKAAGYDFACLRISTDADTKRYSIIVNLSTGAVTSTETSSATNTSYAVQSVGNGWYRLSVTASQATSFMYLTVTPSPTATPTYLSGLPVFTGDGFSGIFVWGGQIEFGSFATSYIPTTTAAATRAADNASMSGANVSSWFNAAQGTLFADAYVFGLGTNGESYFLGADNAASTERFNFHMRSGGVYSQFGTAGSGFPGAVVSGSYVGVSVKASSGYKTNDFAGYVNAGTVATNSTALYPWNPPNVGIGYVVNGGYSYLNGWLKKFAYYPVRVTNAQLTALTS